jgi:hypothetical protein
VGTCAPASLLEQDGAPGVKQLQIGLQPAPRGFHISPGLIEIQMRHLRLTERQIELRLSEIASDYLADAGYDPQFGARPLKRLMQKEVENRVARALLDGRIRNGDTIEINVRDGKLVIEPIVSASQASGKP